MTIVTMPDGTAVDFGDMPPDQIRGLIQKRFPKETAQPVAKPMPSIGEDVARTVPSAVARAPFMIAGAPADLFGFGMQAGNWIDQNVLGNPGKSPEEVAAANPLAGLTSGSLERAYTDTVGVEPFYDAQTNPGKLVDATLRPAVAAGLGGGIGGGLRAVPRTTVVGGAGGAGGEFARQKTEGTKWELPASLAGTLLGAGAGEAGVVGSRRLVTPRNIPPENARAAAALRREGITGLTEGQITQSKRVQAAERQRLGAQGDARRVEQLEQLTRATLRRAGINANRATPDVLNDALSRFDTKFRDIASRNTMRIDQRFNEDLMAAMEDYYSVVNPSQASPIVQRTADDIIRVMQRAPGDPTLPGDAYQATRSRFERLARNTSDPELKQALRDIRNAFDGAMDRSVRPEDAGAWREVRNRYRNFLVVEDAATRAGSDSSLGLITPSALSSATKNLHGKRNFARGQGDLADLSRSASALMTELPLTGAAPIRPGSVFNSGLMFPLELAGRGVNRARMSGPVQRYLTNRALPPPNANPIRRSLLPAVPGIQQQAPNYTPVIDALSAGPTGAPMSPIDPQTQEIVRLLMQ